MVKVLDTIKRASGGMILSQFKGEMMRRAVKAEKDGNPITEEELRRGLVADWNGAKAIYTRAGVSFDDLMATGMEALEQAKTTDTAEELPKPVQIVKMAVEKIGRNEKCPCGSGLKFKKCCGKGG